LVLELINLKVVVIVEVPNILDSLFKGIQLSANRREFEGLGLGQLFQLALEIVVDF
jgi:hypothetical protein